MISEISPGPSVAVVPVRPDALRICDWEGLARGSPGELMAVWPTVPWKRLDGLVHDPSMDYNSG